MRIRKNANLSSYLNSHASGESNTFQTHVCLLNQSPWDVIPFSQHHHHTTYPFQQFEEEDSFNGNGSLVDSIGAVESVASMMEEIDEKSAATIIDNVDANESQNKKRMLGGIKMGANSSKKSEAKSWHFKNNSNTNAASSSQNARCETSVAISTASGKKQDKISSSRRGRGTTVSNGKKGSEGNPYEFYYYSGFGPSWGKRRGSNKVSELGDNNNSVHDDLDGITHIVSASPPRIEPDNSDDNIDVFDEVDEDDDEDEITGKKRMRKPIKARSLKSLM